MAWRFAEAFGLRQRLVSAGAAASSAQDPVAGVSTRSRAEPRRRAACSSMGEVRPFRERKPPWFKRPAPGRRRATASCAG